MAGIGSEVYDIFHPTPIPLKELSAIIVSLEVWRYKMNEYRNNRKLNDFSPFDERILIKTLLPDSPSAILGAIDKYVVKFGRWMDAWLRGHHGRVFYFDYDHHNDVLEHFEDFVCDYYGAIDFVRTAKRMMLCDQFNERQKFIIACTYFFEDDIRQLWPSVSNDMDLNGIDFSKSPQLYYWICCLTNQLDKIPIVQINDNVEEVMLNSFMPYNRPSVEYFWNRLPPESRMRKSIDFFERNFPSFVQFILPKLNHYQLGELFNDKFDELMRALFSCSWQDEEFALSTWMLIQNLIDERTFANQVIEIIASENERNIVTVIFQHREDPNKPSSRSNWHRFCCELWNSAPENLKRSTIRGIIFGKKTFIAQAYCRCVEIPPKEFALLSAVLSYAAYEERKTFWYLHWHNFIDDTRCKDFEKILKLCFEKQDELTDFKDNVMATDVRFRNICIRFMTDANFDQLNDYANLLWPEKPAARCNFMQQIFRSALLDQPSNFDLRLINKAKEFDQFINTACGDVNLSKEFKNQLMSSPELREKFKREILFVSAQKVMEFINTFVSTEEILVEIKTCIIDYFKEKGAFCKQVACDKSTIPSVLSWCLGSNEEAVKFERRYMLNQSADHK